MGSKEVSKTEKLLFHYFFIYLLNVHSFTYFLGERENRKRLRKRGNEREMKGK